MKKILASIAFLACCVPLTHASSEGWLTNFDEALAAASKSNKPIFADFTGSDWCGWCVKLQKDTFTQAAWKDFAKENLVLLEVDFPQSKKLPQAEQDANNALAKKFEVRGFPTLLLIDAKGNEIARHGGYMPGGPEALIGWIKSKTN